MAKQFPDECTQEATSQLLLHVRLLAKVPVTHKTLPQAFSHQLQPPLSTNCTLLLAQGRHINHRMRGRADRCGSTTHLPSRCIALHSRHCMPPTHVSIIVPRARRHVPTEATHIGVRHAPFSPRPTALTPCVRRCLSRLDGSSNRRSHTQHSRGLRPV